MLDNVFRWNVGAVLRNIREAEVISLFFPYLGRALIIDLRHDEAEGPVIAIDGIVSGPQERIDKLKVLRPRFNTPENLTLAPWIGSVRTLDSNGVLAEAAKRLRLIGYPAVQQQLEDAYRELLLLERCEALALIHGDVRLTRTLYQR